MSSIKQPTKPTIKNLYFVLGNISYCWRAIGIELKFDISELDKIESDFETSDRRMIELFDLWIERSIHCHWISVVGMLERLGENALSRSIAHYTEELRRIERSHFPKYSKPLKEYCYDDQELQCYYFHVDKLDHCSIIDFRMEVFECLLPRSAKWYEIGIALEIPKAKLDEIEKRYRSQGLSVMLVKMIDTFIETFSFKSTWRILIDVLSELNFNTIAMAIEDFALTKCGPHTTMTKTRPLKYTKSDFTTSTVTAGQHSTKEYHTEEEILKYTKKIRDILCLPVLYVSDEDILEKLCKYILIRNLCREDLNAVFHFLEEIANLAIGYSRNLAKHAQQLGYDMKSAKVVLISLKGEKRKLEVSKGRLEDNSREIRDEIDLSSERSYEKSKLSELEVRNQKVIEDLKTTCEELSKCIENLEQANANYLSINEQLTECRKKLNTCKRQLLRCNRSIMQSQDHFPDVPFSPEFQDAIFEALKELEAAASSIEETQRILDSFEHTDINSPNCHPDQIMIYVKSLVSMITLFVNCSETIANVKLKIQEKVRNFPDQQRLFYEDQLLDSKHTISHYNIQNSSTLFLVLCYHKGMHVFVKCIRTGIIFLLEVDSYDTIETVKFKIKDKYRIAHGQELHLKFASLELENEHCLLHYGIQKESMIYLD